MKKLNVWVCKIICFIGIFILLNIIISFVIEIPKEKMTLVQSKMLWDSYQADDIDTLIIGTSLAAAGINPDILDEITGYKTYNMGSVCQLLNETEYFIDNMTVEKNLKRVIYVLDRQSFKSDYYDQLVDYWFYRAIYSDKSLDEKCKEFGKYITRKENIGNIWSIKAFFPWVIDFCTLDKFENIQNNFSYKYKKLMGKDYSEADLLKINAGGTVENRINSKGYMPGDSIFETGSIGKKEDYEWSEEWIDDNSINTISEIIDICNERNVEFIVVSNPFCPSYDVVRRGFNEKTNDFFSNFFRKKDVAFYDFHYAKPELFLQKNEYMRDYDHFNDEGATAYTKAVARVLTEDTSDLFYNDGTTVQDYDDKIYSTWIFSPVWNGHGLNIEAGVYSGKNAEVEYKFLVKKEGEDDLIPVTEYQDECEAFCELTENGKYTVVVYARRKGSNVEWEQKSEDHVWYWEK